MNIRFDDATVIVTGAAHGFGREIAHRFAALGARVWACDILEDELAETKAACDGWCEVRVVDVTDRDAVQAFVQEVESATPAETPEGQTPPPTASPTPTPKPRVLINNAGGVLGQVGKPIEEVRRDEWQSIFDVNTTGAFWFAQAVAPAMKAAGQGRIINISSGAGLGVSLTGIQAYASAKAAQIGLTRQLAHELGPHGITVNNIAPGFVRSNPTTEKQWQSYGEEGQRELVEGIAMRRLGTPADIAHAVLFLASDYAGWITGEVLRVSGGR
ncbi:MAG: SDR family oxidoreductase [Longimicrobiales bacterium]